MGRRDDEDGMTMRIVAILLSLSCLALRAQYAPFSARCLMLAAISRAEAVARFYALGAGVPALAPVRSLHDGQEPAVIANLALRLRMLALVLLVAAVRNVRLGLPLRGRGPAPTAVWRGGTFAGFVRDPAYPDTS